MFGKLFRRRPREALEVHDWADVLRSRADFARKMANDVPPALTTTTDLKVVEYTYRSLEAHAREAEALVNRMQDAEADEKLISAAEAIHDVFSGLASAAAKRMSELRGV